MSISLQMDSAQIRAKAFTECLATPFILGPIACSRAVESMVNLGTLFHAWNKLPHSKATFSQATMLEIGNVIASPLIVAATSVNALCIALLGPTVRGKSLPNVQLYMEATLRAGIGSYYEHLFINQKNIPMKQKNHRLVHTRIHRATSYYYDKGAVRTRMKGMIDLVACPMILGAIVVSNVCESLINMAFFHPFKHNIRMKDYISELETITYSPLCLLDCYISSIALTILGANKTFVHRYKKAEETLRARPGLTFQTHREGKVKPDHTQMFRASYLLQGSFSNKK